MDYVGSTWAVMARRMSESAASATLCCLGRTNGTFCASATARARSSPETASTFRSAAVSAGTAVREAADVRSRCHSAPAAKASPICSPPGIWPFQARSLTTRRASLGHVGGCTPGEEAAARQWAARVLIGMDALMSALRWADDLETVADELWVDVPTLMDRLDGLDADEKQQLIDLHHTIEQGA